LKGPELQDAVSKVKVQAQALCHGRGGGLSVGVVVFVFESEVHDEGQVHLASRLLGHISVLVIEEVARLAHDHESTLPAASSHAQRLVAFLLDPAREICEREREREREGGHEREGEKGALTRRLRDSWTSGVRWGEGLLLGLICAYSRQQEREEGDKGRSPELKIFGIQAGVEEGFPSICSLKALRL
jgi:hypothetical protein